MLFVAKSEDGTIQRLTVGDYDDFGGLLGRAQISRSRAAWTD
jgi:hypothetical protein